TPQEIQRSADENAEQFVSTLAGENRATRLRVGTQRPSCREVLECDAAAPLSNSNAASKHPLTTGALENADATKTFHTAAERLPMLRAIYPEAVVEQELVLPESVRAKSWQRADAIRELIRGRMEVCGPISAGDLTGTLVLQRAEIDAALLSLEAEGFVLRGK